jgi:hypothetical protein
MTISPDSPARARNRSHFSLELADNGAVRLLTLIETVLAISRTCSQWKKATHARRQWLTLVHMRG